jgi:hypothetical protein
MSKFAPRIQAEVARVQGPKAIAHLARGQSIMFGDITLAQLGITCRGKDPVPWSEIKEVEVLDGLVWISQHGRWFALSKVQAKDIPNLCTFLHLTEHLIASKGSLLW